MSLRSARKLAVAVATLAVMLATPLGAAAADDDDREVRKTGTCSRGSETTLRARSDDGSIRVELRIRTGRSGSPWRVIFLHERRIAYRGVLRTSGSGTVRLRRTVRDLYGRDSLVVRSSGPRQESCRVAAEL